MNSDSDTTDNSVCENSSFCFSYHGGHSGELCAHASDDKRAIIQSYLDKHFQHVAITEHLPPNEDAFLYPDEIAKGLTANVMQERFKKYFFEEVQQLKQQLRLTEDYLFGFETEFYGPKPLQRLSSAIAEYKPELLVASIHHVADIPIDFSSEIFNEALKKQGSLKKLRAQYLNQQFQLLEFLRDYKSSIPVVVGHFDVIRKFAGEQIWHKDNVKLIRRNIDLSVNAGFAFDLNTRPIYKSDSEPLPSAFITDVILEAGGKLTLGDDSHSTAEVGKGFNHVKNYYKGPLHILKQSEGAFSWQPFS